MCTACAPNYNVKDGDSAPLQATGACASSRQCYGKCSGGFCCKATSCDASGNCAECPAGYLLTSDYFCLPANCPKLSTSACLQCPQYYSSYATYNGDVCSPGYYNAGGKCLPEGCNPYVHISCSICDVDWNCAACVPGFYFTPASVSPRKSATCNVPQTFGYSCTINDQCASNRCLAGYCCQPTVPAACQACGYSYGRCTMCPAGTKLSADYQCFPTNCKPTLSTLCTHCDANKKLRCLRDCYAQIATGGHSASVGTAEVATAASAQTLATRCRLSATPATPPGTVKAAQRVGTTVISNARNY